MTEIRHIFFDIGGVLGSNGWDKEQRQRAIERFDLDPEEFWQIHRAVVVRVDAIEQVSRNFRGNHVVHLKGSAEKLEVSRTFNHLFKQM